MPRPDESPLPRGVEELRRLPPKCIIEIRGTLLNPPVDNKMHRLRVAETPIAGAVRQRTVERYPKERRRIIGTLVDCEDRKVITYPIVEDQLFRVLEVASATVKEKSESQAEKAAEPAVAE